MSFESDDVYHGLSLTQGEPGAIVDLHLRPSRPSYVGASLARVNLPGIGPAGEFAVYAGKAIPIGDDWRLAGSAARFIYSRRATDLAYDFTEIGASIEWRDLLNFALYASPDTSMYSHRGALHHGSSIGSEFAGHYEWGPRLTVGAGLGYRRLGGRIDSGYTYGDLNLTWNLAVWQVELQAIAVDRHARALFGSPTAANRLVVTAIRRFGPDN